MAIQEITSPPLLDETGQDMVDSLQAIANAVNSNAGQIDYSNTTSQLQATKVQGAIDEVKGITDTISSNLAQLIDFEDVTISNVTVASNSVEVPSITAPSREGYRVISASVYTTSGSNGGRAIIIPRINNSFLTVYNPLSVSITISITIRYVLFKEQS